MTMKRFHGSYAADDVTFLLKPIPATPSNLQQLTASVSAIDYAGLIASETPPGREYITMFKDALALTKVRLARHVARVAYQIAREKQGEIVVTSLVRAGTPIGVLLHRALLALGRKSVHYSISATRKRGSDPSSLDYIIAHHNPEGIVFVDGWTGKGYIAAELAHAVSDYNRTRGVNIDARLAVLADLAGVAGFAASAEDFLVPAAMLRSIVCGLISASMVDPEGAGENTPDCCLYYAHLLEHDMSRYFVDYVWTEVSRQLSDLSNRHTDWSDAARRETKRVSDEFVDEMMRRHGIIERNHVKPGICEANRALLTRNNSMMLILRGDSDNASQLTNLVYLAQQKEVEIDVDPLMPYSAAVLLKS